MREFMQDAASPEIISGADVPDDGGPVFDAPFWPASIIRETFPIGTVTRLLPRDNAPVVESIARSSPEQMAELLSRWMPHTAQALIASAERMARLGTAGQNYPGGSAYNRPLRDKCDERRRDEHKHA